MDIATIGIGYGVVVIIAFGFLALSGIRKRQWANSSDRRRERTTFTGQFYLTTKEILRRERRSR